ncbi:AbrB family transcriptional regulator, partial [Thioclava sp. BHET1]
APAGALLGAAVATVIASAIGAKPLVPVPLRNLAFTMIGLTLGAAVTPDFLSDLHRVAGSLAILTLSMALTVLLAGGLLVRLFGADPATAVLATSPGAMSYALALTTGGIGDPRRVMVLQSLRLVLITVCLPPAIGAAEIGHA